jgi:uncharacterized linocin/CFP29 family protein
MISASTVGGRVSLGRDGLNWSAETWNAIDLAVHEENVRAGVVAKVIPLRGPMNDALAIPAETIDLETMSIDERALLLLLELSIDFSLTRKQVDLESELRTGVTLARRAATLLTQAEDVAVLLGDKALGNGGLPPGVKVTGSAGSGLLAVAAAAVTNTGSGGEAAFGAVAEAYSTLQGRSHTGPYGLFLDTWSYAASHEPLDGSAVLAADRIRALVQGFHGTPALAPGTGVLISVGGDTVDLVVGVDPTVAFLGVNGDDRFRFRAFERFALRVKDASACVRIDLPGAR